MGEKIAIIIISILTFLITYFVTAKIMLEIVKDFERGSRKRKILILISILPVINFMFFTIYWFIFAFIVVGKFCEDIIIDIKEEFKNEKNN